MRYDEVFDYTGQMGWYQWNVVIMLLLVTMSTIESITMIFVGADMPHWCQVPQLANFSYNRQKYIAIPIQDDEYSACEMYDLNYDNYSTEDYLNWNRTLMAVNDTQLVPCSQWIYEQTVFVSTIVSRFDLICGDSWLNQLVSTIYMAGTLIGGILSGAMSDRIGRKSATMTYLCIRVVGFSLATFAPNYPTCVVGRFILGVGSSGCFLCAYVLVMEFVGPKYRTVIGCTLQISLSVGFMLQPLISSLVRHDVKYQMAALGPSIIFLTYFFLIPESPRWLIVAGKTSKGEKLLRSICSVNGAKFPDDVDLSTVDNEDGDFEQKNCLSLMRTPRMRARTIIVSYLWFTCSLMYYAMSLNTGALSGDIFINTAISGAVEVPALVICALLLGWRVTGRRLSCSISFVGAGISSIICIPLILYDYGTAVTGLSMVGKAFITMTYSIIYVFASEVFPTEVRNVALGTGSLFGGIGSTVAPYVGAPMAEIWAPLPSVVFGVLASVAGFVALLLPETLGQPLLDTIEQAELFDGKSPNSVLQPNISVTEELHSGSIDREEFHKPPLYPKHDSYTTNFSNVSHSNDKQTVSSNQSSSGNKPPSYSQSIDSKPSPNLSTQF